MIYKVEIAGNVVEVKANTRGAAVRKAHKVLSKELYLPALQKDPANPSWWLNVRILNEKSSKC